MGLNHSRAHPRVTKVTPLQNKQAKIPSAGSTHLSSSQKLEEKSSYSFEKLQDGNKALEEQLPPLRESWYRGPSAVLQVPTAMYFDIPLEPRETSIIKRHPPRRLQKLEAIDLPQVITSERFLGRQEARTRHNTKAQVELKKNLPREAKNNKQKQRNHKAKKTLESIPKNGDYDVLTILPDETMNRRSGNSHDSELLDYQARNEYCHQQNGKMETWLHEKEAGRQLVWDSWSSDSDELEKDETKPRPLVRTRTEKILLYDEFFDQE
ncbi:factor associated with metabolism and energy isoform X2 [Dipodomys merriami]|uniref:factor associated with metabolism and energy isoform X2 n=1 Tax=Dipodomys merriami TaxID=94247 RepID=UPI00384A7B6F